MRQLAVLIEEHSRSLDRDKHMRGPIVVVNCVVVWLDCLGQEVPLLAIWAKEMRAQQG